MIRQIRILGDAPLASLFPVDSIRGRLARGTFWSALGAVFAQGLGMIASILIARLLGQAEFGQFGMIRSTVLMFGVLGGTGLGTAATKYLAEFRNTDPVRAGRQIGVMEDAGLVLGGGATLLCLFFALPLADQCIGARDLADPLRLASPLILLSVIAGIQRGALLGLECFRTAAWVVLLDAALSIAFVVPAIWKYSLEGGIVGLVLAAAVGIVVKWRLLRRECRIRGIAIRHRQVGKEAGLLWSFALPALLVGLSTWPFEWLARLPLARASAGFDELGVFMAAYAWGPAVMFLPGQLITPSIPLLTGLHAAGDRRFGRLAAAAVLGSFLLGLAVAAGLAIFSGGIMSAYGPAFAGRRTELLLLLAAYAVASGTTLNTLFLATGRMWLQALHYGIWGTVLVGGSFLLRRHGAVGLSSSYLIAYTVLLVVQLAFAFVIFRPKGARS